MEVRASRGIPDGGSGHTRRRERGQGMLEFALCLVILLTLILGTVDFARLMYYQAAISSAARTGAEMAMNHCPNSTACGTSSGATTYDYVLQAATCESPGLNLLPSMSCTTTTGASPCISTCPSACGQDICVNPSYSPGTSTVVSTPIPVVVNVGYHFSPVSFLIRPFLESNANPAWKNGCFTGDPPHTHTMCASATGRILSE